MQLNLSNHGWTANRDWTVKLNRRVLRESGGDMKLITKSVIYLTVICKLYVIYILEGVSLVMLMVKNPPANAGDIRDSGSIPDLGRPPPEEGMATHSRILTWRIPWTEEPGRLQPIGLQRVGHYWKDLAPRHTSFKSSKCVISLYTHTAFLEELVVQHFPAHYWGEGILSQSVMLSKLLSRFCWLKIPYQSNSYSSNVSL